MSLLPTPNLTISAPVLRARLALHGAAEINDSSTLGSESADGEGYRTTAERRRHDRRLSHSGTGSSEPLWNGPRLTPAFVAQVLGQVMMDAGERSSASAYRGAVAQIAPGAFFDCGT
jgi:hypothetical protein